MTDIPPQCPSCGGFKDRGHKCPTLKWQEMATINIDGNPYRVAIEVAALLQAVSEERDELKAELEQCLDCCKRVGELEAQRDRAESDRKQFAEDFALSNTALAECQRERDALREVAQTFMNHLDKQSNMRNIFGKEYDDLVETLAATKGNDDDSLR